VNLKWLKDHYFASIYKLDLVILLKDKLKYQENKQPKYEHEMYFYKVSESLECD